MQKITRRRSAGAVLTAMTMITVQGCTSMSVGPSLNALSAPAGYSATVAPGSRVVLENGMGGCGLMGNNNNSAHASQAALQKAQSQLQQAGFQVITAEQAGPADYRFKIASQCSNYNTNAWLYLLTLGVLPMWSNNALVVTSTLSQGDRVLGQFNQSYKVSDYMSLYTPSAFLLGGSSSPERFERVLDFNPQLIAAMAGTASGGK